MGVGREVSPSIHDHPPVSGNYDSEIAVRNTKFDRLSVKSSQRHLSRLQSDDRKKTLCEREHHRVGLRFLCPKMGAGIWIMHLAMILIASSFYIYTVPIWIWNVSWFTLPAARRFEVMGICAAYTHHNFATRSYPAHSAYLIVQNRHVAYINRPEVRRSSALWFSVIWRKSIYCVQSPLWDKTTDFREAKLNAIYRSRRMLKRACYGNFGSYVAHSIALALFANRAGCFRRSVRILCTTVVFSRCSACFLRMQYLQWRIDSQEIRFLRHSQLLFCSLRIFDDVNGVLLHKHYTSCTSPHWQALQRRRYEANTEILENETTVLSCTFLRGFYANGQTPRYFNRKMFAHGTLHETSFLLSSTGWVTYRAYK